MSIEYLESDFDKVNYLVNLMTARATGLNADDNEFVMLRRELLQDSSLAKMLPPLLRQHRDLDSFWGYIKNKFSTYAERRTYISEQFTEVLDALEFGTPFKPIEVNKTLDPHLLNPINSTTTVKIPTLPDDITKVLQGFEILHEDKMEGSTRNIPARNKRKVFIVHGHDNEAKQEVSRFVESLGLEAIVLHENASLGKTIIEKIEHYSNDVDFAIVLYTACDLGRSIKEENVSPSNRARQNVVFEHGYLMAKLGRENVCALVKGSIETPNDISGVVYVDLDTAGGWKNTVAKELKSCGYSITSLV